MGTTDNTGPRRLGLFGVLNRWQNTLVANPRFQSWAARTPFARYFARKDGEKLFDLVAGFVYSQTLFACVELDILTKLQAQSQTAQALALSCHISLKRMEILCNSAVSIGLLKRVGAHYTCARLGAAVLGVPGLTQMIRHHDILYRDMADPLALLRDEADTELAAFWPYVLGQDADKPDASVTARYSDLMAKSQAIVAEETLQTVSFTGAKTLMDVGGGTGAFLREVAAMHPDLPVILFDLPDVVAPVTDIDTHGGSFLDPLPAVADTISLIRVLYDHSDETITRLLHNVFNALPSGGRLIISEPMSGGAHPVKATDSYFAFYTMAMRTGQVRSQREIADHLRTAGFKRIKTPKSQRAYITSVVTATKL